MVWDGLKRAGFQSLREKCPNTELFLVRIFLYSDLIRRFTKSISFLGNLLSYEISLWDIKPSVSVLPCKLLRYLYVRNDQDFAQCMEDVAIYDFILTLINEFCIFCFSLIRLRSLNLSWTNQTRDALRYVSFRFHRDIGDHLLLFRF